MISLIRLGLVLLIVWLVQRAFSGKPSEAVSRENDSSGSESSENKKTKVAKEIGEYVDYEEVDK